MKRVSLADVARAAGVGKATASRALSGRDEVGAATRERILDIADSMGYRPHRSAQALRTGRSQVLGCFAALRDPTIEPLLRALAAAAVELDYYVLLGSIESLAAQPNPAIYLGDLAVDGALVVLPSPALRAEMIQAPLPVTIIDRFDPVEVERVAVDAVTRLILVCGMPGPAGA